MVFLLVFLIYSPDGRTCSKCYPFDRKSLSYSCRYGCSPVKKKKDSFMLIVGSFVCTSLLFASCLLTSPFSHVYLGRGGYHSVKQYPHASLGVLLSSASSSCAFWEGEMNYFQKATRRWQSCKHRLKPGPLTQVRFPRYK